MLFQNLLKAVFAATIFASPYHDPRNDESNEWGSSPSPITSEDQDEQFQHHLKMFKTFRPQRLSRVIGDESDNFVRQGDRLTSVWNSEPRKLRSGLNDIADELQKQIDELRKKIKKVEEREKDATSKPDMIAVQSEIRDMQSDLQALYKKMNQLDQSQKQQFKQTIDQLNKEMIKMEIDLSDRITDLEEDIQKTRINAVIGNVRDGQLESASQTLLTIKDVDVHIQHIISRAFKERDLKSCSNVLKFIELIDLKPGSTSWRDKLPTNKVKSYAFKTVFEKLSTHMYNEMSECVFRLAWKSNRLEGTLEHFEQEARDNIKSVMLGLPLSVRYLLEDPIHIRKDSKRCENVDKKVLGDYQEWACESFQTESQQGGDYFFLKDYLGLKQALEAENRNVYLGSSYDVKVDKRLWKPIYVSNERLQFQHKASGRYLSYENSGSCYKYVLSYEPYSWYISNWV